MIKLILRKSWYCLILTFCFTHLKAQEDSIAVKDSLKPVVKIPTFTYMRFGIDLTKLVASAVQRRYNVVEFTYDIHYKGDIYLVADAGWGNSSIQNNFLSYKSNNTFLRVGIDKTFFSQEYKGDLDNAFIGVRYGLGFIHRIEASYAIEDLLWGNTQGSIPSSSFLAHWLELTGGFRLELLKNIFVGWNIRVKTFLNQKKFNELPPAYVAGYGAGDKSTAFGYNFYLLYGLGKRH